MKFTRILSGIMVLGLVAVAMSCGNRAKYRVAEGVVWSTTYHITYKSDKNLDDTIRVAMAQVDGSLSAFNRQSVISQINRCEGDRVDRHIEVVMAESQRVNRVSGGMFDPTLGPLINLWGFGTDKDVAEPSDEAIDSCLRSVGIADCAIVDGRMVKKRGDTQFNFSAIAKGYGVDLVAAALRRNGCEDYMVEIGGEMALRGKSPRGDKWRVMIDAPNDDNDEHEGVAIVSLSDCSVATSGNYRNYRETSAGRVGHTISPVTGRPVSTSTVSATVVAPTTMTADALATACMTMPADSAAAMIEGEGRRVGALLVIATPEGLKLRRVGNFPEDEKK